MRTATALLVSAGMTMAATSALARDIDAGDLLGTWEAEISGENGSAEVRVVFQEGGTYIAMALMEDEDDPVDFWEIGTWELDGSTLTFSATGSSEEMDEADQTTEIEIESLEDGVLSASSEDDPMWDDLEFELAEASPIAGIWTAETPEGEIMFLMADGGDGEGQFAGGFMGEDSEDTFWGTWTMEDDTFNVLVSEDEWSWEVEEEGDFEEHASAVEDLSGDTLMMVVDGMSEDAMEFSRQSADVLVGDWTGNIEGSDVAFSLDGDGSFRIAGDEGGQEMEIEGVWTHLGDGQIFLVMSFGDMHNATVLMYRITSPTSVQFGEQQDDMAEFTRD